MSRKSASPAPYTLAVMVLILFSFFMSALVSQRVFERLPHLEDELAYLYQARIFARGDIVIDSPEPRTAFWQPFVIDYPETGNRFGKYTPGYPALLAIGVQMGQPWVINALLGALTVALVYRFGAEVFNQDVGLVAAALTAFSPMALLLNAAMMGHTAALFFTTLFVYSYWRIEKKEHMIRWAVVGGIALGFVTITRPLTGISIALPFVTWSLIRLVRLIIFERKDTLSFLRPMLVLAVCAIIVMLSIPLFNAVAVGDPSKNLYTLVWDYDRIGFGDCCGRNGHTLEKGIRHTRFDLSLTAADLFGWQIGAVTLELQQHLQTESDYWEPIGLSFFLLPFGVLIGVRGKTANSRKRMLLLLGWSIGAVFIALLPLVVPNTVLQNDAISWGWLLLALGWVMLPLLYYVNHQESLSSRWTWLFFAIVLSLVLMQMTYWIGSQRYSTRYYFEALTVVALISALPLAWLARHVSRLAIYGGVAVVLLYSLYTYSTPRITALYRFNGVGEDKLTLIEERRESVQPILLLVGGESGGVSWRAMGTYMALTSPYLDSDLVLARVQGSGIREAIVAQFPNHQIIEMQAAGTDIWFVE